MVKTSARVSEPRFVVLQRELGASSVHIEVAAHTTHTAHAPHTAHAHAPHTAHSSHAPHAAHTTAASGGHGSFLLGSIGDDRLGREHEPRHAGGVLERGAHHFGGIDDARVEEVFEGVGGRVEAV